jgi:hypothetical protein
MSNVAVLSVVMLSVANKPIMLGVSMPSVAMLSVVRLSVVAHSKAFLFFHSFVDQFETVFVRRNI